VRTHAVDIGTFRDERICYLVMDFVSGRNMRQMIEEMGGLPETLVREVARQVAEGLVAIHAHGVIHRDLKPENILIAYDVHSGLRLLADIQYLHYEIEDLSKYGTVRFFGGARIRLADELHLHLGASIDVEAQATASAGLAWAPSPETRLGLSYQYNAFPEVRQEYGRFQQISVSFSLEF